MSDQRKWRRHEDRLTWDQMPGRQFIRLEGSCTHSGATWYRVYIGEAMSRRDDDPEAIMSYRATDIVRLCRDGDIDLHTARVTHWMPAKFPTLTDEQST